MVEEKKEIKLRYPIPIPKEGGGMIEIDRLQMGRLKAKHLKLLPRDAFGMDEKGNTTIQPSTLSPLIAGLADIPESSADEIDFNDLMDIMEIVLSFLGESPLIGRK